MTLLLETGGRLRESSNGGKRRSVTIIEAGWGSSGYYPEDVLSRDIPTIFPAGSPMYLDHPTLTEEYERPERSVRDLVGKLVETPHLGGIGMQSVAEVYDHWVPFVNEVAGDIGLSIRAFGTAESGTAGGREGPVVSELTEGISVDYVTVPGAGGKVGEILESGRAKMLLREARSTGSPHVSREALQSSMYENLEEAGTEMFSDPRFYVYTYVDDYDADAGYVVYCVREGDGDRYLVKVSFSHTETGIITLGDSGEKVARTTVYEGLGDITLNESDSGRKEKETTVPIDEKEFNSLKESFNSFKSQTEEKLQESEERAKAADSRADRAEEALLVREARDVVRRVVEEIEGLPERAQDRAVESALSKKLPVDDGQLDTETLQERARVAAASERDYLAGHTETGKPRGLSESARNGGTDEASEAELKKQFEESGMTPEQAEHAAKGR